VKFASRPNSPVTPRQLAVAIWRCWSLQGTLFT